VRSDSVTVFVGSIENENDAMNSVRTCCIFLTAVALKECTMMYSLYLVLAIQWCAGMGVHSEVRSIPLFLKYNRTQPQESAGSDMRILSYAIAGFSAK
jgi:hypothetical protein